MKYIIGTILMTITTILGSYGYIPQIVKMYKTKSAEDISDGSWWLYTIASLTYVIYFIFITFDIIVLIEALLELILNTTTLLMSIYYKSKEKENNKDDNK